MSDYELQRFIDKLIKNKKALEFVKIMEPLDVVKVFVKDFELCPHDASRATLGLIKQGISFPSIETNKQYPVPPLVRGDDEKRNEHIVKPYGKTDITPRYIIFRHQFPPDPRETEPEEWPYDAMTKASMKPSTKQRKRPLTTGKKVGLKKNPFDTDLRLRQPGGDGAGGGGHQKRAFHSKSNNMSMRGGSWTKRGYPGWSSSLSGKEFDLPYGKEEKTDKQIFLQPVAKKKEKEKLKGKKVLYSFSLSDEEDLPVGRPTPSFYGGRSPNRRMGFRRR